MYFIFALVALLCWSCSDLFSKMGTDQNDKNSHWRVFIAIGLIMGLHAVISIVASIFIPAGEGEWWRTVIYTDFTPLDFVRYLPVAFIYLLAMVFAYVGHRYIELSVSSPICSSSGSLALIICLIIGWAEIDTWSLIGVTFITVGIVMLGVVEYRESDEVKLARQDKFHNKYTKSLLALALPIIYFTLDALATVGDQMISELELFNMSEYASNTAYEFTSLCFAIFGIIWIKLIKKEKLFVKKNRENGTLKYRYIGSACETAGQMFYMTVMFSDFDAGMPMISAYCALSVLWSRVFLKEKLSLKHYISIAIAIAGVIILGIFSPV